MPEILRPVSSLSPASVRLARFAMGLLILSTTLTTGCRTVKDLATTVRFCLSRQEALVIRIDEATETHLDFHDQIATASEVFIQMQSPSEETLRRRYQNLSREYLDAEQRLKEMAAATGRMEEAAQSFFLDWERRLYEYANPEIRGASREQMDSSREKYEEMLVEVREMQNYSKRVLGAFGDQVRFLRHNLNEEAVEALRNPAVEVKLELRDLMEQLEAMVERLDEIAYLFRVE